MEDASRWGFAGARFLVTPVAVSMVFGAVVEPDEPAVELMSGVVAQIASGLLDKPRQSFYCEVFGAVPKW